MINIIEVLERHGIQPTPRRVAVAVAEFMSPQLQDSTEGSLRYWMAIFMKTRPVMSFG